MARKRRRSRRPPDVERRAFGKGRDCLHEQRYVDRQRGPQHPWNKAQTRECRNGGRMRKSVVIAEDHAFTAAGLCAALGEMGVFDIVGVAANGIEAISLIKQTRPDCAILDVSMPGANGLEVLIEARRWSPATRVAIVTGSPSPQILGQLVEAGVDGIFLKNSAPETICAGIRAISAGEKVIPAEVAGAVGKAGTGAGLTAREIEVLHAIARGLSNAQIGEALGVSAKTVDSHRTTLMRKMGVHSTASLLVLALRDGLIDI